jgi:hypothetical protein
MLSKRGTAHVTDFGCCRFAPEDAMLVELDTAALEEVLKKRLRGGGKDLFLTELCGRALTCDQLLKELSDETPLAKEVVEGLLRSSLTLWIARAEVGDTTLQTAGGN